MVAPTVDVNVNFRKAEIPDQMPEGCNFYALLESGSAADDVAERFAAEGWSLTRSGKATSLNISWGRLNLTGHPIVLRGWLDRLDHDRVSKVLRLLRGGFGRMSCQWISAEGQLWRGIPPDETLLDPTEAGWLRFADPLPLLGWLNERDASARKLRLFSCACVRSVWELMPSDLAREAVLVAERFADGHASEVERRAAENALRATYPPRMTPDDPVPAPYVAGMVAFYCAWSNSVVTSKPGIHVNAHGATSVAYWTRVGVVLHKTGLWRPPLGHPLMLAEAAHQGQLLHDLFGNPFRADEFDPRWRTADAVELVTAIYEERAFDRLRILADALMDAGCNSEEILSHCRSEGPHVRGCWVVDLVLKKA